MLVWTDLETTGLIATREKILEVACVITDDALNEVARFQRVTTEAKHHDLSQVNPYVLQMHASNGLWNESLLACDTAAISITYGGEIVSEECRDPRPLRPNIETLTRLGSSLAWADHDLAAFISEHCSETGEKKGPQLAGSTISFDRSFMQEHLPRAHTLLHYRNLDVSTLNELARRFWPAVYEGRPRGGTAKHRAMDDVLQSLECARYYTRAFGIAIEGWVGASTTREAATGITRGAEIGDLANLAQVRP